MTSKASMNALLVAGGVAAASAVWAAAIYLPARLSPQAPAAAIPPAAAPQAAPLQAQAPEPPAAPAPETAPRPVASRPAAHTDPAAFGVLPVSMAAPAPAARTTMLDGAAPLALASTPLQSIGATFADPAPGAGLPELGGAASLDGPADAGLDEPVQQAALPEPQAPPPTGKIIVIDASEGTKLDPLRQRNWDLNAVQVIPPMVAPPKR